MVNISPLGPHAIELRLGEDASLKTFAAAFSRTFGTPPLHEEFHLKAEDITGWAFSAVCLPNTFSVNDQAYLILWGVTSFEGWRYSHPTVSSSIVANCLWDPRLHPVLALALLLLDRDDIPKEPSAYLDNLDKRLTAALSGILGFRVGKDDFAHELITRGFPRLGDLCMSLNPLDLYHGTGSGTHSGRSWPDPASLPVLGPDEPTWKVLPWLTAFLADKAHGFACTERNLGVCRERFGGAPPLLRNSTAFSSLLASFPGLHAEWCDVLPYASDMERPSVTEAARYLGAAYLLGTFSSALLRLKKRYTRKISALAEVRTMACRIDRVDRPKLDAVLPVSLDTEVLLRWFYKDKGNTALSLVLLIDLLGYRLVFPGMHRDLGKTSLALGVTSGRSAEVRKRSSILLGWLDESERRSNVE